MEHKAAIYGMWGVIFTAVITGAVTLYINYDNKKEQRETEKIQRAAEQSKNHALLTISKVYVPPVNTQLDSIFFAEISNDSHNVANNVQIKLDFGEASISKCETLPTNYFTGKEKYQNSIVSFDVKEIRKMDKLYVYCQLSHPIFKTILVTGANLYRSNKYSFDDLSKNKIVEENSGFVTFFKVIASIVALVFIVYFTIVILSALNRKFKIE